MINYSNNERMTTTAAAAEKDAIAYIDCIFHRRYAEHLPLVTLLHDMRHLKNRSVLSYVGAMPFCQRAFLQTRTHLYRIYNDEIYIFPKDYRDSIMNLVDYVNARTRTTLSDLYAFCSTTHPALIKAGDFGSGLQAFRRFLDEHPTLFEIVEPAPKELDQQEIINQALVVADVLLFPKIKIAVGRVVNINGNTAYLECQGEFVTFHSASAGLAPTEQLKTYLMKGDLVPFEARYSPEMANGVGGPVIVAAAGVSSTKLRNVWKALAAELPRTNLGHSHQQQHNDSKPLLSPRTHQQPPQVWKPFDSPAARYQAPPAKQPATAQSSNNSYMAPVDDALEWMSRRSSGCVAQKRDSSTNSLAAACAPLGPPGAARMGGGIGGLLTPPFSTVFSKHFNPFLIDVETQAGSGRPYVDKAVQTEVTDEELMLRLIRKYPNLLDNLK